MDAFWNTKLVINGPKFWATGEGAKNAMSLSILIQKWNNKLTRRWVVVPISYCEPGNRGCWKKRHRRQKKKKNANFFVIFLDPLLPCWVSRPPSQSEPHGYKALSMVSKVTNIFRRKYQVRGGENDEKFVSPTRWRGKTLVFRTANSLRPSPSHALYLYTSKPNVLNSLRTNRQVKTVPFIF